MSDWRKRNPSTFILARGETISIRLRARKCRLSCMEGRLWVTAAPSRDDSVMGPGDDMTFPGWGVIVIEAMRDATVRVETRAAAAARQERPASLLTRLPRILPY